MFVSATLLGSEKPFTIKSNDNKSQSLQYMAEC